MKDDFIFDRSEFRDIQIYCTELKSKHAARDKMDSEMESIFMMEDMDNLANNINNAKVTISPDSRNKLLGAHRLLTTTEPTISMPHDTNDSQANQQADKLETMARKLLKLNSVVRDERIEKVAALSMLLFDEVIIAVTRTSDMLAAAKTGKNKVAIARIEELADLVPYTFDLWHPSTFYPDIDSMGLNAFYREVEVSTGFILDTFGARGKQILNSENRYSKATLCEFRDVMRHYLWTGGEDGVLLYELLDLPIMPVIVQLGEGSRLFSKIEYWRQPFLYAVWKSALNKRQNLILTKVHDNVFAMATNPTFVYKLNDPKIRPVPDFSKPGGAEYLQIGESVEPKTLNLIDASIMSLWDIDRRLLEESTIYGQTLGEPLGSNAAYSMVALLHQAGRLPLAEVKDATGKVIAKALKTAIQWMKADGRKAKVGRGEDYAELDASEIPDRFDLACDLEIALPQDNVSAANIASRLKEGENPIVSTEWILENILKVSSPKGEMKKVLSEKALGLMAQIYMQDQIMAMYNKDKPKEATPVDNKPSPEPTTMPGTPGVVQNAGTSQTGMPPGLVPENGAGENAA